MPYNANKAEQEIIKYWDEHDCFTKSIEQRSKGQPYVFYDGPPFATGLPHYGHIVASLMKDVVPRYWAMNGFRIERKWGWDCHGLPIENIIEKKLNLNSKQDILDFGIDKFNEACRQTVLTYAEEWKKTVNRMGRWVDMENGYKTMDKSYMESVWWVFKELWDKELIYEGYKSMHICPRCVTPLSNFEVTQGYKDVKDLSVIPQFKLLNSKEKLGLDGDVFMLAWTTTPWTLPGNVLLAVGGEVGYVAVEIEKELFILAKERVEEVLKEKKYKIIKELSSNELEGLEYEPLFPYFADNENSFRVIKGDFVNTEEGTGVVHIAPAFGDDDYRVGQAEKAGWIQHVTMEGKFVDEVTDFAGREVKPKEDPTQIDVEIIKYLAHNGKLFSKAKYEHSYPHCWRCDTPLLNYATASWFVKVTEMNEELLKNNKKINWIPQHIKEGRFGKWLEGARDWAISRTRFWGTPLPIWKSEDGDIVCVGSATELEKMSGQKVDDLHKHMIDDIVLEKDGKQYRRIPEVLDCWFESGSMPYGQMNYPFSNKEKFEAGFPAQFIAEGQDQTRGWFYTLHVLATALTRGDKPSIKKEKSEPAFTNVIVNGIVLAEDGKKMSKRLENYPDPMEVLEKYGADAMRYYLVSSPVMHSEGLNFSEQGVREMYNKVANTAWNVLEFYLMYANKNEVDYKKTTNVLDKWILAKLQLLVRDVTDNMNGYKLAEASRPIMEFITELSQWFVRRSRNRFKVGEESDKQFAVATLREVLLTLSKVMAPFTPFIAEKIYLEVGGSKESVHLADWPKVDEGLLDDKIMVGMEKARKIVEMGLSLRAEQAIKVKQPLSRLVINDKALSSNLHSIIAEEINVKSVEVSNKVEGDVVKEDGGLKVVLDTELTPELKKEGLAREIIRAVNQIRKEKKLSIDKKAVVTYSTDDKMLQEVFAKFGEELKKNTASNEIREGDGDKDVLIGEHKLSIKISEI